MAIPQRYQQHSLTYPQAKDMPACGVYHHFGRLSILAPRPFWPEGVSVSSWGHENEYKMHEMR